MIKTNNKNQLVLMGGDLYFWSQDTTFWKSGAKGVNMSMHM